MEYVSFTVIPLLVTVSDSIWETNSYVPCDFRDTLRLANYVGMAALNVYVAIWIFLFRCKRDSRMTISTFFTSVINSRRKCSAEYSRKYQYIGPLVVFMVDTIGK